MAFLRYWLSLVAGMGAIMLLALVPLGIGWLVERASGSKTISVVVTLLAITLGMAALNWWIWGTATGDRCVAWLARTIGPPSRH